MPPWPIRRLERRSLVHLVCAVLFIGLGIVGAEHGSLYFYLPLAALCAFQYAHPTPLGWLLVALPFALLSVVLFVTGVFDLLRLAHGAPPVVLVGARNSALFAGALIVMVGLTVALVHARPRAGAPATPA